MNRAHLNVHDAFQAFPNLSHKLSDSESTSSYCGTGGTIIWVEKPASCSSRLVIPNPSNESCLRQPEDTLLPISGANARVDVLKDGTTGPAEKSRDSMALSVLRIRASSFCVAMALDSLVMAPRVPEHHQTQGTLGSLQPSRRRPPASSSSEAQAGIFLGKHRELSGYYI